MLQKVILVSLIGAFAYWLLRIKKQRLALKKQSQDIAPRLSPEAVYALRAYQHYFESGQPEPVRNELLDLGLIVCTREHKYGITKLGAEVGKTLGLYSHPVMVMPVA